MKKIILIVTLLVILCLTVSVVAQLQTNRYFFHSAIGQPAFQTDQDIIAIEFDSSINNHGIEVVPDENLTEIAQWLQQFTIGRAFEENEPLPAGYGAVRVTVTYADGSRQETALSHIRIGDVNYEINSPNAPENAMPPLD